MEGNGMLVFAGAPNPYLRIRRVCSRKFEILTDVPCQINNRIVAETIDGWHESLCEEDRKIRFQRRPAREYIVPRTDAQSTRLD